MHKQTLKEFKTVIRAEVISMKQQSIAVIEDAFLRILEQVNKGELRNIEREMELFQTFFFNKIQNFNMRIRQTMDHIQRQLIEEKFVEVMHEKDKIESYDQELQILGDQIR